MKIHYNITRKPFLSLFLRQYLRTLVHLGTILRNSVVASEIEDHAFATTYEHPFLLSEYCEFGNLASFASTSKTIEWII